jgi:thiamine-phosphate pyrophosphorylase
VSRWSAVAARLYLITPPAIEPAAFSPALAAALDAGDVGAVQLRLKGAADDAIRRAVQTLIPEVQARNVAFLLDDRADLAAELGCDGVHLGPDDMPCAEARLLVGDRSSIGFSAGGSRHLGIEAAEAGADYISFGPFFPSTTKDGVPLIDVEIIGWWSALMEVPCVAVGGVTAENCASLIEAGADFLAVSAGVWRHPDGPAAAVRAFAKRISG